MTGPAAPAGTGLDPYIRGSGDSCDECGAVTDELVSTAHSESCSLHPGNISSGLAAVEPTGTDAPAGPPDTVTATIGGPIVATLVLATAHLPEEYGSTGLADVDGVHAFDLDPDYGWLMSVPVLGLEWRIAEYAIPAEIAAVLRHAHGLGCRYVLFDRDADIVDDLPTWDW